MDREDLYGFFNCLPAPLLQKQSPQPLEIHNIKYLTNTLASSSQSLSRFLPTEKDKTVPFEAKIQYKSLIRLVTLGHLSGRGSIFSFGLVSNGKGVHFLQHICSMNLCLIVLKLTTFRNSPNNAFHLLKIDANISFAPTSSLGAIPADVSASSVPACGKCNFQMQFSTKYRTNPVASSSQSLSRFRPTEQNRSIRSKNSI